jgi:hypothetical protein
VLKIKDEGPFFKPHTSTIVYESGTILPKSYQDNKTKANVVTFRGGGSNPRENYVYGFLGTEEEYNKWSNGH